MVVCIQQDKYQKKSTSIQIWWDMEIVAIDWKQVLGNANRMKYELWFWEEKNINFVHILEILEWLQKHRNVKLTYHISKVKN